MSDAVPEHLIYGVEFAPHGAVNIAYSRTSRDLKENGVALQHTISVPPGDQYDDEIAAVQKAIEYLLRDVLDDLDDMPALDLSEPEEDSQ